MTAIDTSKLKPGDKFCVQGDKWLSKEIVTNQVDYTLNRKFPWSEPRPREVSKALGGFVPSHWGTLFFIAGRWYIAESTVKGYKFHLLAKAYDNPNGYDMDDKFMVFRCKGGLTQDQQDQLLRFALELEQQSITYGFFSLVYWELLTYAHVNLFSTMGESMENCYETTHQLFSWLLPDLYPKESKAVPYWFPSRDDDMLIIDNRNPIK